MKLIPFYTQYDAMDCGPTCLRMIRRHSLEGLREKAHISREGVSMLGRKAYLRDDRIDPNELRKSTDCCHNGSNLLFSQQIF
jgi:hypothetical protein